MSSRAHIVLVPGFAGFDALGQIQYYAGTTDVFREWLDASADRNVVLHYFDNLPSGAVKTRAKRLRKWLSKRIARNELQPNDTISLVGHSTGGLDIRQLIADLSAAPNEAQYVDGQAKAHEEGSSAVSTRGPIMASELLGMIKRVVFISTPHHGSNIADAVDSAAAIVRALIRTGRALLPVARPLSRFVPDFKENPRSLNALLALIDAVREADPRNFRDQAGKADALEAYSQLLLYIAHMASDFGVIEDLLTGDRKRVDDLEWPSSIATCSFASYSHTPSRKDERGTTDLIYRAFHRFASRGAFAGEAPALDWFVPGSDDAATTIDDAASDGVVNTRSMYWKHGGPTKLVRADHGDIIGHYRLAKVHGERSPARRYDGYDFFKSGTGFSEETFRSLWREIFTFCARGEVSASKAGARSATRDARPAN